LDNLLINKAIIKLSVNFDPDVSSCYICSPKFESNGSVLCSLIISINLICGNPYLSLIYLLIYVLPDFGGPKIDIFIFIITSFGMYLFLTKSVGVLQNVWISSIFCIKYILSLYNTGNDVLFFIAKISTGDDVLNLLNVANPYFNKILAFLFAFCLSYGFSRSFILSIV